MASVLMAITILVCGARVAAAQDPAGWEAISRKGLDLMVAGKGEDAAALLDRFVTANPRFGPGHDMLADAHRAIVEKMSRDEPATAAARRRHLETAALHYRRAIELKPVSPALTFLSLAEVYGPDGLNQPRDAETPARRLVAVSPSSWLGYGLLAWSLAETGRTDAAITVLRGARSAVPADSHPRLAASLCEQVLAMPLSSAASARVLLGEALVLADEAVTREPASGEAWMLKSTVLDLQAKRVETDAGRKQALLDESARLGDKGRALNTAARGGEVAVPPPPPDVPDPLIEDAKKARELALAGKAADALAIYRRYVARAAADAPARAEARCKAGVYLFDLVSHEPTLPPADARTLVAEADAMLDEALTIRPDYMEAVVYRSLVLRLRAARFEPDPARAKALVAEADRLRARATELQKRKH